MQDRPVEIRGDGVALPGDIAIPPKARAIVLFAHGSGSSRQSPRNRAVAKVLNGHGLGTLLFDLLTDEEAEDRNNVFDIDLLASRLVIASRWVDEAYAGRNLLQGFFGASTGAAAALVAAARLGERIYTVVSRGGRPDLAKGYLPRVQAPVLLIVGGEDDACIPLNRSAAAALPNPKLVIIPGATHLFEEPGTLDQVASLAAEWFTGRLNDTPEPARKR